MSSTLLSFLFLSALFLLFPLTLLSALIRLFVRTLFLTSFFTPGRTFPIYPSRSSSLSSPVSSLLSPAVTPTYILYPLYTYCARPLNPIRCLNRRPYPRYCSPFSCSSLSFYYSFSPSFPPLSVSPFVPFPLLLSLRPVVPSRYIRPLPPPPHHPPPRHHPSPSYHRPPPLYHHPLGFRSTRLPPSRSL